MKLSLNASSLELLFKFCSTLSASKFKVHFSSHFLRNLYSIKRQPIWCRAPFYGKIRRPNFITPSKRKPPRHQRLNLTSFSSSSSIKLKDRWEGFTAESEEHSFVMLHTMLQASWLASLSLRHCTFWTLQNTAISFVLETSTGTLGVLIVLEVMSTHSSPVCRAKGQTSLQTSSQLSN